jgi:hypothetical protein
VEKIAANHEQIASWPPLILNVVVKTMCAAEYN